MCSNFSESAMTKPKALIIDDNPSDRALALRELKKLFSQFQYEEIIDESGFSRALERGNFNIVITDYQLLWTTGIHILDRIKKHKPECPVIMFTGTGSEEIAVSAMKAGLDDYVIKSPQHYVRLAAAVRSAWQRFEQKKALQEFKQTYYRFFERIPLGLYRLNIDGEIVEANSTLAKMLGYQQPEDIQGNGIFQYHLQPETYLLWQQQLNQYEAVSEFEGQIRALNGELIWVRHHAIAIRNTQNNLIGYEGAIADITANKQAELEKLELLRRERKARQEAETVNRIKDEFLATLSHELRTPLNAIIGWVQLLRTGMMDEARINRGIDVIDRNAKAQNKLIDDLLDVSRIIRGTMALKLKPTDLIQILTASIDTVRPSAIAKNIEVITQIESQTIEVNADIERLQQIFWNILINAIKFTPAGGQITVAVTTGSSVVIKVQDTGQGIAADVLPYVFDRFRQAETKSSTRTHGGLGLGLAIVRHLVEIHGGRVMADSAGLGKGATFTIELPVLNSQPDTNAKKQAGMFGLNSLPTLANLTLLVVEDDADAREVLTLALEQHDAKVVAADSVEQALIQYRQHQPDILIGDISMPTQDGYALIEQIRASQDNNSQILAIALTANAREEDKQKALQAGFDLHIAKPIEPIKLVESISTLIRSKK